MWLFSGVPDDLEDDTVMEQHGADALYSPVKSLMHAICHGARRYGSSWE